MYVWVGAGGVQKRKWKVKKAGRTEHGTGAGITVTADGSQEGVPISSLRVKQKEEGKKLDRTTK